MSEERPTEITPAYRTLDEPTKLIGLSIGQWGAVAAAGALAYGWLLASPLPWRSNVSLVVVLVGTPLIVALLREQGALSAPRLFSSVWRWRFRPSLLLEHDPRAPASAGAVRLDQPGKWSQPEGMDTELPWLDRHAEDLR